MLIILSGLPGTGKTTIAKALASKLSAAYVRVDEIENALAESGSADKDIGPAGYIVAFAIARSNLSIGNMVIADSVSPVKASREGWRRAAHQTGMPFLEIECSCSDEAEHRRRVETRVGDVPGWKLPSWADVRSRAYEPWDVGPTVIDTAQSSPEQAVRLIEARIATWPR